MMHALCGLKVESDIPLPDLLPWTGDGRRPDVEIRLGDVPEHLENPVFRGSLLQVAADGTCRIAVDGVAAYLVERGRRVTVQPCGDASALDVRTFLLGTAFGALCHQRGLLPLHACSVDLGGRAVAFAGVSGAGKSTLAAAFLSRGYAVLADDVTVVDAGASGGPLVLPSFPRIRLWRDALDGLGHSPEGLQRVQTGHEKFLVPIHAGFRPGPLPLAAVYHLSMAGDVATPRFEAMRGVAAVDALAEAVYRRGVALRMGRRGALLTALMRLAPLPSFRLVRARGFDGLDATVAALAARHGG